jgi:hypothetical protein
MRVVFVLLGLALLGCGGEPSMVSSPPSATPPVTTAPPTAAPAITAPPIPAITAPPATTHVATPTPPATTPGPCGVHETAFRAALASATGACHRDDDCACYSPVVEEAGCGGITDARTARTLSRIQDAWQSDGCRWPRQCGPSRCEPVCREGRCVRASQVDPASL